MQYKICLETEIIVEVIEFKYLGMISCKHGSIQGNKGGSSKELAGNYLPTLNLL